MLPILPGKVPSYKYGPRMTTDIKTQSELPSNLIVKKVSPKIWLPFLTIVWGTLTMCLGFVSNFGSFVAVRALLGMAEGGNLPGIVIMARFYFNTL